MVYKLKKKKRLKYIFNLLCLIKCFELLVSIVISVIFFDGIGYIIGDCRCFNCLWVCDWLIFDNKEMLIGFYGEVVIGKIFFIMFLFNCGVLLLLYMI